MKKDIRALHSEFMEQCRYSSRLRPATLQGYQATFRLFESLSPDCSLEGLTPSNLTTFFRSLDERVRLVGRQQQVRRGVRNSTIMSYRTKLSAFIKWLLRNGHIKANPLSQIAAPTVEYENRKYIDRVHVERIFVALAFTIDWKTQLIRKRNIAMFSVLLHSGVRAGELLGLRLVDFDTTRQELTIRSQTSKSRRQRQIPLNSSVTKDLVEYLRERNRVGRVTPHLWVSGDQDRGFTADGLKHLVEQVKQGSGVRFHLHQLRHTFAVNLLCAGTDVQKLKQLLGHRDIRMTSTYLRCLPTNTLRADVEQLGIATLI